MLKLNILLYLFICFQANAQKVGYSLFNKGFNYSSVSKHIAISYFDKSIAEDSTFSLSYYYRGLANFKLGNYSLSISDFDKTLIIDSTIIKSYIYKGFAYRQLNKPKAALESFEKYMENKPNMNNSDYLLLAKSKTATGDFKGALKTYEKILKKSPSEDQLYNLFLATYEQKKYHKSLILINKIIKLNPTFYGYYLQKGKVESQIDEFDTAIKNFDKSIKLNPNIADSYFLKGNILDTLSRLDEALESYTKAIQLDPTDGVYYFKRGNTRMALNKHKGACLDWTIAGQLGYYENFDEIKKNCL